MSRYPGNVCLLFQRNTYSEFQYHLCSIFVENCESRLSSGGCVAQAVEYWQLKSEVPSSILGGTVFFQNSLNS